LLSRRNIILVVGILLLLPVWQGKAAHLVGGEISYRCLGNNDYEIRMIIYRDGMSTGAPFDPTAVITIYNSSNNIIQNRYVSLLSISNLPLKAPNNCTSLPNNVVTEKGLYIDTVNLPPIAGGYTITHQRCCRNNTITNINNANSIWGSTYTTSIPSLDNCNSSPRYASDPPVVLCVNQSVDLDLSATDFDGDSLHYELCAVLHGGANAQGMVMPDPAAPPPYTSVPFNGNFSSSYPITSNPAFSIDPGTGTLSGRPTQVGQFVFAICVTEYENGIPLSTTRRDFQFNVTNACKTILSKVRAPDGTTVAYDDPAISINNPVTSCSGRYVNFATRSQFATKYFWDFGDTALTNDTSRLPNPFYTYRDTGTYLVMHVAEPYSGCADTSYVFYRVFDSTKVEFTYNGEVCFDDNAIDFAISGRFSDDATLTWDFDGATNLGSGAVMKEPKGVSWLQPGIYYVTVSLDDFGCTSFFGDTVKIIANPIIDEEVLMARECAPYTVQFKDRSTADGRLQHLWFFGDGNSSGDPSPVHTYLNPGIYTVEHVIRSLDGCLDSAYSRYQDVITVFPVPTSDLEISSKRQSIYEPVFEIRNRSTGHLNTVTVLPNGQRIENLDTEIIQLEDTGRFEVTHISFNEFGCTDTVVKTLYVEAPFQIHMPNAFTPNGDGINDVFTFGITDIRKIHFEVYNRWGEVVFSTDRLNHGWNGKIQNTGETLPAGTYSYVLIATVKTGNYDHVERGSIKLIR
jgi:gliding motility-associated-like protein